MSDKRIPQIPLPTLKRLPVYYQYLTRQARKGVTDISCASIAKAMGLVAVQVRKDLQLTGAAGRPKTGYKLEELLEALERTLGYDNKTEMFLVGAGSLGKALLHYKKFGDYNIGIAAAFDENPAVIGTEIDGKPVLPFQKFPSLCRRMHVKFAVICVPAEAAQEVANIMVSSGIEAIWNFAPITLEVPDTVIVHNENLTASLSILLKKHRTKNSGSERE
jgi:redox-sensing transcriptional repressor